MWGSRGPMGAEDRGGLTGWARGAIAAPPAGVPKRSRRFAGWRMGCVSLNRVNQGDHERRASPAMNAQKKKQAQFSSAYLLVALALLPFAQGVVARRAAPRPIPMSELVTLVRDGKLADAQVRETEIVAELEPEGDLVTRADLCTLDRAEIDALLAVPAA